MSLFHITTKAEWEQALLAGVYRAESLETEGFIHLSGEGQWQGTANRYFSGRSGLVLLVLDPNRFRGDLRMETAHGEEFPHLYAPLNLDAVIEVLELHVGADGRIGNPSAPDG